MTNGPRKAPSPFSILRPQVGQASLTLKSRPRLKSVRPPQLGQRHMSPFLKTWVRVTLTATPGPPTLRRGGCSPVVDRSHPFQRREAGRPHPVQHGKEGVDAGLPVPDLDD